MTIPCHPSSDVHGIHQSSFDVSQGSLAPAEAGGGDFKPFTPPRGLAIPVSTSSHYVTSSRPTMYLNTTVATSGFSAEQINEIYDLVQEGKGWDPRLPKTLLSSLARRLFSMLWPSYLVMRRLPVGVPTATPLTAPSCTLRVTMMMSVRNQLRTSA